MSLLDNMKLDCKRLRERLEDSVRGDLEKHILHTHHRVYDSSGKKFITLRIPRFIIPKLTHQPGETEIWHGDGKIGQRLRYTKPDPWLGDFADPFRSRGDHKRRRDGKVPDLRVEFELERLIDLVLESLQTPPISPKPNRNVDSLSKNYSTLRKEGIVRNFQRSYLQALPRNIAMGTSDIRRAEWWYRSQKEEEKSDHNAVVIYLRGRAPRFILGAEIFWLNHLLERKYKEALGDEFSGIRKRYVRYSNFSGEGSLDDFMNRSLSPPYNDNVGYRRVLEIIDEERKVGMENIYLFHYSWGVIGRDEMSIIVPNIQKIMRSVSVFGYTQIRHRQSEEYSLGPDDGLKEFLQRRFSDDVGLGNLSLSYIRNDKNRKHLGEDILNSVKGKLITGR